MVEVEGHHGQSGGERDERDGHTVVQTCTTHGEHCKLGCVILPISGSFSEVGGMLSPMTMRKTVMERRVVMPRVT